MAVMGLSRDYKSLATAGLRDLSQREQERTQANDALKAADKQQTASMVGTGAGMGAMAGVSSAAMGAKFGALAGPVGAVVGAGVGYLISEIF